MCGFLFFFLFHFLTAHDRAETDKIICDGEADGVKDSVSVDQQDQIPSNVAIYITPGTILVTGDDNSFRVVETKVSSTKQKVEVAKPVAKKILLAKKEKKHVKEKVFVNPCKYSSKIHPEINLISFSKTRLAIFSHSNNKIENGNVALLFFPFSNISIEARAELFLDSDHVVSNSQFPILFGRPPPVKV